MTRTRKALSRQTVILVMAIVSLSASVLLAQQDRPNNAPSVTARLETERLRRFQGERFTLTLTIVSRNVRLGNQFNLSRLPTDSTITLGTFRELPTQKSRKDGIVEETRRFRCDVDVLATGTLEVAPVLHYEIKKQERFLLGNAWVSSSRRSSVMPLTLELLPVPTVGRPTDYSGAVGRFSFDVKVNPGEVTVGELVTVSMRIKGQGRLDTIASPALEGHANLKTYPPKVISSARGVMTIEQTVIPQSTNLPAIPAINFSYFDPLAGQYKSIRRGQFPLKYVTEQAVATNTPFRPERQEPAPETRSVLPVNLVGSSLADHYRAAAFIITVVASLLALGALVNLAMGRRTWKQGFVLLLLSIVGALAATWTRHSARQRVPDHVLSKETTARIAPANTARSSFTMPVGSVIKIREQWQHWIRVETEDRSGWVPADSVKSPAE